MTTAPGVTIENLSAFRRDLKAAGKGAEKDLRKALQAAGVPVVERVRSIAARRTGTLRAGYTVRVSGASASISNRVPYAMGAEWGQHGKWVGFNRYTSSPGRFAWRGIYDERERITDTLTASLQDLITLQGWAT